MKRMVVKIGWHTLADQSGEPDREFIGKIARQFRALVDRRYQLIPLISGSGYYGKKLLKDEIGFNEKDIKNINPVLAAGLAWPRVFGEFAGALSFVGLHGVQFVWGMDRMRKADHHSEIREVLVNDLKKNPALIPIVAEKSHKGQATDFLAGEIAALTSASDLIYLTANDGIPRYKRPQRLKPFDLESKTEIQHLHNTEVTPILSELNDLDRQLNKASPPSSCRNLITKLERANHVQAFGIDTWIVNGRREDVLISIAEGEKLPTHITSKIIKRAS